MPKVQTSQSSLISDEYRAALASKGRDVYDAQLKPLLEPAHNGEYVAIHVDSGDYALGPTYREASHALQARHPKDGRMIGWKIGPEPDTDYLALLVAGETGRNAMCPRLTGEESARRG